MSIHPSLGSKDKHKRRRSVLKRYERLGILKGKEKWHDGNSVFGLLKVKVLKLKLKKEKPAEAEKAEEAAAAAEGAPAEAGKETKETAETKETKKAAPAAEKKTPGKKAQK